MVEAAVVGEVLRAAGLTFAFPGGARLFEGLSLTVSASTVIAVTGPSGAGKSTLLYCLAGVLRCDGSVVLQGTPLPSSDASRAVVRLRSFGFVFQRGELLPELSVAENVALPLRLLGERRQVAHGKALAMLEQLGIADCASRSPHEISGGQAQRASLGRALVHGPTMVFADEPTASLDPSSRDVVIQMLRATAKRGAAVLCATHDPALLNASDEVLTLHCGALTVGARA